MALNIIQNNTSRGYDIRNRHHGQPRNIVLLCQKLSCLIMAIVWTTYFIESCAIKSSTKTILL